MGVDYTASVFYGARLTEQEYERIWAHRDYVDAWHVELGIPYNGNGTIVPIETGAAVYSGGGGELFIAAQASVVALKRRGGTMSAQFEIETDPKVAEQEYATVIKQFVEQHNIPIDTIGWFIGMRVS